MDLEGNRIMIIYKCENKISGKCYIGQTTKSLNERMKGHIAHAKSIDNNYFHNALNKYGFDKFIWSVIDDTASNMDELNKLESYYIGIYNSFVDSGVGYNLTTGGGNCIKSKESIKKTADFNRGRKNTPESILRMSLAKIGVRQSTKTRLKISESSKGKILTEEHKINIKKGNRSREALGYPVVCLNYNTNKVIKKFQSIGEASEYLNCSQSNIIRSIKSIRCDGHYRFMVIKKLNLKVRFELIKDNNYGKN